MGDVLHGTRSLFAPLCARMHQHSHYSRVVSAPLQPSLIGALTSKGLDVHASGSVHRLRASVSVCLHERVRVGFCACLAVRRFLYMHIYMHYRQTGKANCGLASHHEWVLASSVRGVKRPVMPLISSCGLISLQFLGVIVVSADGACVCKRAPRIVIEAALRRLVALNT